MFVRHGDSFVRVSHEKVMATPETTRLQLNQTEIYLEIHQLINEMMMTMKQLFRIMPHIPLISHLTFRETSK